jgi:hypothetical protein
MRTNEEAVQLCLEAYRNCAAAMADNVRGLGKQTKNRIASVKSKLTDRHIEFIARHIPDNPPEIALIKSSMSCIDKAPRNNDDEITWDDIREIRRQCDKYIKEVGGWRFGNS